LAGCRRCCLGALPLGAPQPPSAQNADAVSPEGGAKTALRFGAGCNAMMDDDSTLPAGATSEPASNCITARQTPYGFWWRYQHPAGEPEETLTGAIMVASEVAATEARKSRKTYVVASTPAPAPAVYVFARNHPDAARPNINIMYELTPNGGCLRRNAIRH
jgi:hypothetical protein